MVQIRQEFIDDMVAHAKADLPNECCGILSGPSGQVMKSYRMANVEASPYRFVMDPVELGNVDSDAGDNDWELLVIYHSHTATEAYPSRTDVNLASEPNAHYVLVSTRDGGEVEGTDVDFRSYRIVDGEVTEEEVTVVERYDT